MIAVIADDFTGAAELGGIGLRYALSVEVTTNINTATKADLLVIDADTRSMKEEEAVRKIEQITGELLPLKPEWIYKKTDSVLRGHVVPELNAQLKAMGIKTALLVPANPNLGRTIRNGTYYFNDQPVHQSSFAIDPEFAITSSDVQEMLKAKVPIAKVNEAADASGIIVGEAREMKDLDWWAAECKKDILPAGAAGFFSALLNSRYKKGEKQQVNDKQLPPLLYVSGTTFKKSTATISKIKVSGGPVSYLPANDIADLLKKGKAIIAIDPDTKEKNAMILRGQMAGVVNDILTNNEVGEIFIEGGSTARAIFDKAGFKTFYPVQELSPGVVRMKVKEREGILITVKPGSYAWPEGTWDF